MKITIIATIQIVSLAAVFAAEPQPPPVASAHKPQVGVIKFENSSRHQDRIKVENPTVNDTGVPLFSSDSQGGAQFGPKFFVLDRYSQLAQRLVETVLGSFPELQLIERTRAEAVMQEMNRNKGLGGKRLAEEKEQYVYGADFLVLGQILDISTDRVHAAAYGIVFDTITTSALLAIQVIHVSSQSTVFSASISGADAIYNTAGNRTEVGDPVSAAIQDAVAQLKTNTHFREALLKGVLDPRPSSRSGSSAETIATVRFDPKPAGVDVRIDGIYKGTTPVSLTMIVSKKYSVTLEKAGWQPWKGLIVPEDNLTVTPELIAVPSEIKNATKP